ncbi:hemicentin-1-like isoform X2 [Mya arenaria]|uniref:hemicentin-1-like isoform X2 n=1 Tax=Mya arenaria TaxID=6604 RepID=UPI0022E44725|nr:hemicentin-1-like isoform X2 [Mya arenaria]
MFVTPVTILCVLAYFRITDCVDITISVKPQVIFENNSVLIQCGAGYDANSLVLVRGPPHNKRILYSYFTGSGCTLDYEKLLDQCTCDNQNKNIECIIATISRRETGLWQCTDFFGRMNSTLVELIVKDNPDKRVFVNNQTNNTDYYLIRNSNTRQSLRCEVNGGNPLATLKWSCYDGIQSDENSQSSAISTVNWIAANLSDSACICSASHILGWTDRRFVNIHVYYEPNPPTCTLGSANVSKGVLNVTLNSNVLITCKSEGNPAPEKFTWTWPTSQTSEGKTLSLNNVQIPHDGLYILSVENIMKPSIGQVVNGRSNTTFDVNIQYPPTITNTESNLVAIEGTNFSINCIVSLGNPKESFVTWKRESNATAEKVGQLIDFLNISRTDEGNFSCVARNRMTSTGSAEEDGVDKQHFYIDVQYKAKIQRFVALPATVKHTEELSFECDIDSDPPANVSIVSPNGTALHSTREGNQLRYRKISSCLEDIGNFTCISENKHNGGLPESRNLTIDVGCSPRYRPNYLPETVVKSTVGKQTTLYFSIFSNPLPKRVIWTNLSNNMQLPINTNESDRVCITTRDDMLSSVVVIKSTEPWDFGNYSVRVENEIGSKTETLSIVLDESPAPAETSSTTNSALIGGSVSATMALIALLIVAYVYRKRQTFKANNDLHVKNDNTQHYENGYEELTTLERRTGEKAYSDLDFQQRKEKNNQKKMSAEDETYVNLKLDTGRIQISST